MRKFLAVALISLAAAACSSVGGDDRGWTGNGAEPFDGAHAACESQAGASGAQFEACMASKGWTRPLR